MSYPIVERRGVRAPPPREPGSGRLAAAWVHRLGARCYHALWDRGVLRARRAPLPVLSVGALGAGGSGKTPLARWLARRLAQRGWQPAVLSRGYRSAGGTSPRLVDPLAPDAFRDGDEPALLARSLPGVPVIVGADRVLGAALAREVGADVAVLDDGFQHRRLRRDVDLVLWDRASARGRGRLLPAGPLREPLEGLARAHLLLLVDRGDGFPEPPPRGAGAAGLFRGRLQCRPRGELDPGAAVHALSGVADPLSFERGLERLGLRVTGATRYADHHRFRPQEIREAARRAEGEGASRLAVTAKDRVRWPRGVEALPAPAVFDLDVVVERADLLLDRIEELLGEGSR